MHSNNARDVKLFINTCQHEILLTWYSEAPKFQITVTSSSQWTLLCCGDVRTLLPHFLFSYQVLAVKFNSFSFLRNRVLFKWAYIDMIILQLFSNNRTTKMIT